MTELIDPCTNCEEKKPIRYTWSKKAHSCKGHLKDCEKYLEYKTEFDKPEKVKLD